MLLYNVMQKKWKISHPKMLKDSSFGIIHISICWNGKKMEKSHKIVPIGHLRVFLWVLISLN